MVVYYYISLLHGYILDRLQFFHPDFETNRKYSFLASIPETPAGFSSSSRRACLSSLATWNVLIEQITIV